MDRMGCIFHKQNAKQKWPVLIKRANRRQVQTSNNSNDKRISLKKNQTKLTIANYLWNSLIVTSQISILIILLHKHSLAGAHCVVGNVHFYECTVPVHTACDVKRLPCGTAIKCALGDEQQTVRGASIHLPLSHGVYSLSAEHFTV